MLAGPAVHFLRDDPVMQVQVSACGQSVVYATTCCHCDVAMNCKKF